MIVHTNSLDLYPRSKTRSKNHVDDLLPEDTSNKVSAHPIFAWVFLGTLHTLHVGKIDEYYRCKNYQTEVHCCPHHKAVWIGCCLREAYEIHVWSFWVVKHTWYLWKMNIMHIDPTASMVAYTAFNYFINLWISEMGVSSAQVAPWNKLCVRKIAINTTIEWQL